MASPALLLGLLADELVHLVVELLHFGDSAVFLEEDLVHVGLRVVVVCHIAVIDALAKDLLALSGLGLMRQIVDIWGLGHSEVGLHLRFDCALETVCLSYIKL